MAFKINTVSSRFVEGTLPDGRHAVIPTGIFRDIIARAWNDVPSAKRAPEGERRASAEVRTMLIAHDVASYTQGGC